MQENKLFRKNFDRTIKEFEEKYGDLAKFAAKETSNIDLHKLLKKEDFDLPREVQFELAELEAADLYDLNKEQWNS